MFHSFMLSYQSNMQVILEQIIVFIISHKIINSMVTVMQSARNVAYKCLSDLTNGLRVHLISVPYTPPQIRP